MTTSAEVRSRLIYALQLDLIGPTPDDAIYAEETLDQAPSKWYLTGFLVPYEAPIEQRSDDTGNEELDQIDRVSSGDDENAPEKTFAKKAFFPSSMGLSILVSQSAIQLDVTVEWGDYFPLTKEGSKGEQDFEKQNLLECWKRIPRQAKLIVPLHQNHSSISIPDSNGLQLVVSIRPVPSEELVPAGSRSVSVFLVNQCKPASDKVRDTAYIFQTSLTICTDVPLVARPNLQGRSGNDWDEKVADLQYRDDYEYAVGHNVSAIAVTNPDGSCQHVHTAWIPTADVEKVVPTQVDKVELGMEALAAAPTAEVLQNMIGAMVDTYTVWINQQQAKCPTEPKRLGVATDLLHRAKIAKNRIAAGLQALDDPQVLDAFRIANRAIATAIRQRVTHGKDITPESVAPPRWRPFQLAFLLMNLVGIANPEHSDRELVDLLFFPTGGGKTEAYLGLAAFTLVKHVKLVVPLQMQQSQTVRS